MYAIGGWLGLVRIRPQIQAGVAGEVAVPLPANVWSLGFTSLFTDISSEMVASGLSAYLIGFLSISLSQF